MRNIMKVIACSLLALLWAAQTIRGQPGKTLKDSVRGKPVKAYMDQEIKRHKWEMGINAGSLFHPGSPGTYQYPYLIKRNFKLEKTGMGKALRFSLSPAAATSKQLFPGDTMPDEKSRVNNYTYSPRFTLGFEWQKSLGRTMIFGGVDASGVLFFSKETMHGTHSPWDDNVIGNTVVKYHRNMLWLGPFLGAKIYIDHRISLSVESHLKCGYGVDGTRAWFDGMFVSRGLMTWKQIEPMPIHLINLTYNL
ncbi:hypothetical protein [Dyadobacter sandarakinus]|uniref:Uncharacterized protein n=1 Tax=Dyadobacter sandarakinus TaxID=2747268 RepID=A0ABX7ID65_9BACT|nr:hypothetical protein [Dyadobacter sandarakinus]QRR03643.1 hypothetical protein HWI92_23365 [Dyadobacter sandarakinus]